MFESQILLLNKFSPEFCSYVFKSLVDQLSTYESSQTYETITQLLIYRDKRVRRQAFESLIQNLKQNQKINLERVLNQLTQNLLRFKNTKVIRIYYELIEAFWSKTSKTQQVKDISILLKESMNKSYLIKLASLETIARLSLIGKDLHSTYEQVFENIKNTPEF